MLVIFTRASAQRVLAAERRQSALVHHARGILRELAPTRAHAKRGAAGMAEGLPSGGAAAGRLAHKKRKVV